MSSEVNMFILKLMYLLELDMKVSGLISMQDTAALWGHTYCCSVSALWLLPALPLYGFRWVSVGGLCSFFLHLLTKLPPVCCVKWSNKQTEGSPNHRAITNHLNLDDCQPFLPTFSGLEGVSYFLLESCMVCTDAAWPVHDQYMTSTQLNSWFSHFSHIHVNISKFVMTFWFQLSHLSFVLTQQSCKD